MKLLGIILAFFFVSFTNKGGSDQLALSQEALSLREQRGIEIDSLDYAVCPAYIDSLQRFGARICHTSRWMNGATIETTIEKAYDIATWSFIKNIEITRFEASEFSAPRKRLWETDETDYGDCQTQLALYNLPRLHEAGFHGQGVTMAVIDGGFQNLNTLTIFDSIRKNGQLLGTFDFADDPETDFYGVGASHGARCLGLIAGNRDDYQGAATQAQFYVMRSEESSTESPKEIDNLVAAIEKCDSLGVWIASVSLGYVWFDYGPWDITYEQLDGNHYRASRAATIAARKGMLLCFAAGNSANSGWEWMNVPADADSVLTVGAVASDSIVTNFSCRGYTADGRVKPDVCAQGKHCCITQAGNEELTFGNGTSYATPLIAGLAACVWSAYPTESNMQIRERIIKSAHQYDSPDRNYGYGIPDAWKAYKGTTATPEISTVNEPLSTKKLFRDGQLIILRDGVEYDILGHYNNTTLQQ